MDGSFVESRMIGCEYVVDALDVALLLRSTKSKTSALSEQKKIISADTIIQHLTGN